MSLIESCETLLQENTSWIRAWTGYADHVSGNLDSIIEYKKYFNEWAPLRFYLPLGESRSRFPRISIRFRGDHIASLKVENSSVPTLILESGSDSINRKKYGCSIQTGSYAWTGKEARAFRKHFYQIIGDPDNELYKRHTERNLESAILDEMERKRSVEKFLGSFRNIKPIEIADRFRFQMPVPLSVDSQGKPKGKKGNIDILARFGTGRATHLTVVELKRPKGYNYPLSQSLIYSVALLKILREANPAGNWWKIFGYKNVNPQPPIIVRAVAMIADKDGSSFQEEVNSLGLEAGQEIEVGQDRIIPDLITYTTEVRVRISNTSLP